MTIINVREVLGRVGALVGLLLAVFFLSGCHTGGSDQKFVETVAGPVDVSKPPSAPPGSADLDRTILRVGDSLTVTFSDLPNPTVPFEQTIRDDGTITLLLNKTFTATNKTPRELEKEIRDLYVPNYYRFLTVTVTPKAETRFYYVDGDVRIPNRYIYLSRLTVLQAIGSAGGFTDFANKRKVRLTRLNGSTFTVNCIKARTDPRLDLEVYPGDKIFVPRKKF